MKTMNFHSMMVLVLAAAVWAGFTQENPVVTKEQAPEEQHTTVQFTATLEGKGGEATKALSSDGTATWAENEEIAVYYQKSDDTYDTATATVTSVDASGNATISATLTDAKGAGTVKFVYPASLHDGTGDINNTSLTGSQYGNLTSGTNPISTNFDAAIGSGTLSVDGNGATINGSVKMNNQLCICRFYLTFGNLNNDEETYTEFSYSVNNDFKISTASRTYSISSDKVPDMVLSGSSTTRGFQTGDYIDVAMLPYTGTLAFTCTYTKYSWKNGQRISENVTYTTTTGSGSLEAGHYYRKIPIVLVDKEVTAATGSETNRGTVTIADGDTYTLNNNISVTTGPAIKCLGDATIILTGSNTVSTTSQNYPAIQAGPSGTTLTIQGSGSLTATGGMYGTGIGSGYDGTCGAIIISGGTVTATGVYEAAGIGSGYDGTCGAIIISGGTVTAKGGLYGASIGSGDLGTCGNITISGGTVTATGGQWAAGIGSGSSGSCGNITISGGEVTTTGKEKAVGIGSGTAGTCGAITISGGTVTATGGLYGAGIGSGYYGKFSSITIESTITSVTATMGSGAQAPIGRGYEDQGSGDVTIDNTLTKVVNGNTWTLTPKSSN